MYKEDFGCKATRWFIWITKKDIIKNLLQSLKKEGKIIVDENSKDRSWILVSSKS